MSTPGTTPRVVLSIVVTAGVIALSVLPLYLLGSLAPLIAPDLGISIGSVGFIASAFAVGSALSSWPGGRFAEQLGPARVIGITGFGTALAMIGFAVPGLALVGAMALMLVGGAANGVQAPATDLALLRTIPAKARGLGFGVAQTSLPLAAFAAGIAVPAIGVTIGWRWAFVLAGVATGIAFPLAALHISRASDADVAPPTGVLALDRATKLSGIHLALLATGSGLTMSVVTATATYLVDGAVAVGFSASGGGLVLALASVAGISMRVLAGWRAGRRDGKHLLVVALMMVAGSAGYLLMAVGTQAAFVFGAVAVFGGAWGWGGLIRFALVSLSPGAPATATGVLGIGLAIGAAAGPALFGVLVEATSYEVAWLVAAAGSATGGLLVFLARRWVRSDRMAAALATDPRVRP